ncbi:hypothetical protein QOZ80_6AG0518580 [Eleusine coracana subsp. coracana]|nr:hypothetical protein QOZ80_6AG0518580 [Eleusine coracana subsp. coracana]
MASAMHLPLLVLCLLFSHTHGSRTFVSLRSIDDSGASPSTTTCPPMSTGSISGNKLPVVHRLSPCSPLGSASRKQGSKASLDEILHRDSLRLRYLSEVQKSGSSAKKQGSSDQTYPAKQNIVDGLPGVYEYTVIAGYGTPAQHFPLSFDASGMSKLRCKPCLSGTGSASCGKKKAFDPSKSSSFYKVPCDSPKCRGTSCSADGSCAFTLQNSTHVYGNGTLVADTFTLSTSLSVQGFAVGCLQVGNLFRDDNEVAVGNIDLSLSRNSLVSRLLPYVPTGAAPFSYCLPGDTDTHGFLSILPDLSQYKSNPDVKFVPLVNQPTGPNFYFVDLVGITVHGKDLPFPPAAYRGNGTMIETQSKFSYLSPPIYAALRDEFRRAMKQYQRAPAFGGLDTCYNVTGYASITVPTMALMFGNGVVMDLDSRQYLYFFREHENEHFPFMCLAFAAAPDEEFPWNSLGIQMQRTKEVVYDVQGKQVGFVPSRCGSP